MQNSPRRNKLQRIADLGIDPWGGRFDNRLLIGDICKRAGEVCYQTDQQSVTIPPLQQEESVDAKSGRTITTWMTEASPESPSMSFRELRGLHG